MIFQKIICSLQFVFLPLLLSSQSTIWCPWSIWLKVKLTSLQHTKLHYHWYWYRHSFFNKSKCSWYSDHWISSQSVSSVTQSCLTLCDPMNCSTPGLPVHHQLPEFTQTHAHRVGDAIQPSHPLSSPSPPAPNPSQHQSLFQWVNSSHQVAKVLEFQL